MNTGLRILLGFFCMIVLSLALGCGDDDDDDDNDTGDDDSVDGDDDDDSDSDDDDDNDVVDDDDDDDDDDNDDTSPVVFVQFTDIHQSRGSGTGEGNYINWYNSLEYVYDVIQPDFVVSTGDLTDGYGPSGQAQADWDDYRNAILDAGFDTSNYHDLPGNHDGHDDPGFPFYLANSISGALMHSWTVDRDGDSYGFIATQTAHDDSMEGEFHQDAYNWTEGELTAMSAATHVFLFSHHNSLVLPDAGLIGPNGLLADHDATALVSGHRHMNNEWVGDGTRFLRTKNHSSIGDGWMRIFTLVGDIWACKPTYVVDRGPQVIIASPQDLRLATDRSPDGHIVSGPTQILAAAFGDGLVPMVYQIDDQAQQPMNWIDHRWYEVTFDFSTLAPGQHSILVADMLRDNQTNGVDMIQVVVE
jgi:Calcineurin-like phosphoesterase